MRLKPFGDEQDEDDLVTLDPAASTKVMLQMLYDELPEFTVHVTSESMQAFLGMQPGGVSPLTPKARSHYTMHAMSIMHDAFHISVLLVHARRVLG
jgi:hypothetical protein